LAKAFCEGRTALIAGLPTNPHQLDSDRYTAWQAGYDTVTPEGLVDNCAECIPITVPNIVGNTSAVAQAFIATALLGVGKITGTTGVVTVQSPIAGAKAQRSENINFTIA
jgi:hypothetical protein